MTIHFWRPLLRIGQINFYMVFLGERLRELRSCGQLCSLKQINLVQAGKQSIQQNGVGYLTVLLTKRKKFLLQRSEFPDVHQMYYVNCIDIKHLKEKIGFLQL